MRKDGLAEQDPRAPATPRRNALDALFRPRSVAVVGASSDPNKIGGRPLAFLRRAGYGGAIYPVNPGADEVQGIKAYRSVAHIEDPVEHAIIAVSPRETLAVLKQCAEKGVRAAQVFSSGFGETGAPGRELQEQLVDTAREAGIRLIGPNSLGLFNVQERFFGTFATVLDSSWPTAGDVSLASQSGGFGSLVYLLTRGRGLGFSHFITTGNETDVDIADCIRYLADESCTRVIVAAFEGCRDGRRLMAALEAAHRRGKPVIVMKLGATEVGAKAVESHTGALAGTDAVFDAAFRQGHAHRARSLDELVDCAYAASRARPPRGPRLGIVTFSGGVGVLAADAAARHGIELPPLPVSATARIKALLPTATAGNPLDTSAALVNDLSLYARVAEIFLEETGCDIFFGYLAAVGRNPEHYARLKQPLFELRRRHPEVLFVLTMACTDPVRCELEREGFLWFEDPQRAVAAAAASMRFGRTAIMRGSDSAPWPRIDVPRGPLNEVQSKRILAHAGIAFPPERVAHSADAARGAARELGFPVALKVVSADIPHKSDVGGVRLDIRDEPEVAKAFLEIMQAVASRCPHARVDGVLVSAMVRGGVETVLGVMHDAVFGPVVMFGMGGTHVELVRDVAFRLAPFGADTARQMIEETLAGRALKGVRGSAGADIASLADTLARLSGFAASHADLIRSIDLNPYVAKSSGGCALDALVVPTACCTHIEESDK